MVALLAVFGALLWSADRAASTSDTTALAGGYAHDCLLDSGGGVQCWGNNIDGQLGLGGYDYDWHSFPERVPGLSSGVAAITADERYSCALDATGGASCWGDNTWGQLGRETEYACCEVPGSVTGLSGKVTQLDAGQFHACALLDSGDVECWGSNSSGQLGTGVELGTQTTTPTNVAGVSDAVAISAGGRHTCVLTSGRSVKCWGLNAFGQLGNNSTEDSSTAVDVVAGAGSSDPLSQVVAISAGWGHTCALTEGGVKCWGINDYGQLGNGTSGEGANSSVPVDVAGLDAGVAAVAASIVHTCALTDAGGVKCWGSNDEGELGHEILLPPMDGTTPVDVPGLTSGVTALATGYLHTCAIIAEGVTCWGYPYGFTPSAVSKTPPPTATMTATHTATATPTITPTPFKSDATILVTHENAIHEYTASGKKVQTFDIPYGSGDYPPTEYARDLVIGWNDAISVYNGTFDPFLSTYDLSTDAWSHLDYPDWSTVNNGSYGGIAAFDEYVYVTDMYTSGAGPSGIVRFDMTDGTAQRFADGVDFIDVTAGLDGLLYGLYPGGSPNGTDVNIYHPLDLTLVDSIELETSLRGIAVNAAGAMFGVEWDGDIVRIGSDGAVLKALASGAKNLTDIDVSPNGTLVVGSRFGNVVLTDESLTDVFSFGLGSSDTFVAFGNASPPATATPTPTATATPTPTVTPSAVPTTASATPTPTWLAPTEAPSATPTPTWPAPTEAPSATPIPTATLPNTATPTETDPPDPTPTAQPSATPKPTNAMGDVTCDGETDSVDALAILQTVGGLKGSTPCQSNGDVNNDGSLSAVDAALILQYAAGIIDALPYAS